MTSRQAGAVIGSDGNPRKTNTMLIPHPIPGRNPLTPDVARSLKPGQEVQHLVTGAAWTVTAVLSKRGKDPAGLRLMSPGGQVHRTSAETLGLFSLVTL